MRVCARKADKWHDRAIGGWNKRMGWPEKMNDYYVIANIY